MPTRLLAIAERLDPPFVLLEDGRGQGTSLLAWGAAERRRVAWSAAACGTLDAFDPGDGWVGAIGYDLGLPARAARRRPFIEQPLVDLFRPLNRIIARADGAVEFRGAEAQKAWDRETGGSGDRKDGGERVFRSPYPPIPRLSFTQAAFETAAHRALRYIASGDIYQVNLSVAERVAAPEPALTVYRRLRAINPSPWMGYADFGDWQLVSGSPELLVEVRGGEAHAQPIAGTRKKTGDTAADARMRRELISDAKEAAEHVMLVDLARNDLGRVAQFGSVRVAGLATVEEYSHVMHLVSDVRATLVPGADGLAAFRAMFPGGTITGAPKIRAMEIIAELEPCARGMYTGALGWWEGGDGQWNILIRSAVVRDGMAVIQAGAGIVADSDPEREWKESLRKAAAMRVSFGLSA